MNLRSYQTEAISALYAYFAEKEGNPLLVLPTGSGKSVIQAAFQQQVMAQWPDQRILLLTHVRELIEQNADKLVTLWPEAPLGIYAAGLNRREHFMPVVMASIQSVHSKADLLGRFDLIIIDEAHLVPTRSSTMYRRFLADMEEINPHIKIIGMSATPFRLDSGYLHKGENAIFTDIAYELPISELIDQKYLVPVVTKGAAKKIDLAGVGTRAGEFITKDLERAVHDEEVTAKAITEILAYGAYRHSWLVFCVSVDHGHEIRDLLRAEGVAAECLHGGTPKKERTDLIAAYRAGEIKALTNCDVLTTGFDAPATDMIVFLRPTKSASLYIQMTGRGMRLSPDTGKRDCLVLDFAGNVERHGPVDAIEVSSKADRDGAPGVPQGKECPDCLLVVSVFDRVCPECGHGWPLGPEKPPHEASATERAILSNQIQPEWVTVSDVQYRQHHKPGKPDSLRVDYICGMSIFSEWVCIEHQGYAQQKARWWYYQRGIPFPNSTPEGFGQRHALPKPTRIKVKQNGRFDEIIDYEFSDEPELGDQRDIGSARSPARPELRLV